MESDFTNTKGLTLICKGDNPIETYDNPQFRTQVFQTPKVSTVSVNTEFTELDLDYLNHTIPNEKWIFFSLIYDGSQVYMYLNNKLVWSYYYSGKFLENNSNIFIGYDIPGEAEFFKGALDDFKLYNYALTSQDIEFEYSNNSNTEDLSFCSEDVEVYVEKSCLVTVDYLSKKSINCGSVDYEYLKGLPSGSKFNLGKHEIVYSVNYSGNKEICNFTLNVLDATLPIIICPKDTIIKFDDILKFEIATPIYSDNCGVKNVNLLSGNSSITKVGEYQMEYEVIDLSNNKATCMYNIIVEKENKITGKVILKDTVKKDITILKKVVLKDSIKKDRTFDTHNLGKVSFKDTYVFTKEYVTISAFDDHQEDNDTISIFYNNKEIVNRQKIKNKKNGQIIRVLKIEKNESNEFIIKAWNTGEVGGNTVRIHFYEGDIFSEGKNIKRLKPFYKIIMETKPGFSSAVYLKSK